MCLAEILVFAIASAPFVVPDVEGRSGLRRRLRGDQSWVDLGTRWLLFSANDLADFLLCRRGHLCAGCGESHVVGRVLEDGAFWPCVDFRHSCIDSLVGNESVNKGEVCERFVVECERKSRQCLRNAPAAFVLGSGSYQLRTGIPY